MHIENLTIDNIRLFEHLSLSFLDDGKPRNWTVLIGENGLGKTTILQSIAMAASGAARTNQLVNMRSFSRRKSNRVHSSIVATFGLDDQGHSQRIYPILKEKPNKPPLVNSAIIIFRNDSIAFGQSSYHPRVNEEAFLIEPEIADSQNVYGVVPILDPLEQVRARNLPNWFVVGYGVDRRLPSAGFTPILDDPAVQRLASLFDKGPIIATGFIDLFQQQERVAAYTRALRQALLKNAAILPKITEMVPRGQDQSRTARHMIEGDQFEFALGKSTTRIPATWLSQGYQSTIAWIADLIGQMFWDMDEPVDIAEMEGLVLIDEIDLHLHPTWQINLIEALRTTFPRLQFVVTTHSPMVLPGLKKEEIFRVQLNDEGNVVVEPVNESPAVMTGSQLYDAFFGINGLFAKEVGVQLQRYGYLSGDPYRSDDEDREMIKLQQDLKQAEVLPQWQPVAREPL